MPTLLRVLTLISAAVVAAASSGSSSTPRPRVNDPATAPPASQPMDPTAALGTWKSSFGAVKIERDDSRGGEHVMGVWVYERDGQEVIGYFAGALDGNVLSFTWNEPAKPGDLTGDGYLVFDPAGRTFHGQWWTARRERGGQWRGWRASEGAPDVVSRDSPANRDDAIDGDLTLRGLGTCFAISDDGRVVTSGHVVEGADEIIVQFGEDNSTKATVVASSSKFDLAVLDTGTKPPGYLSLASASIVGLGDQVFTIGFPAPKQLGWEPKYTDGAISSRSVGGVKSVMQISVPMQPGNSGGPLVTESGEVVGVIFARLKDSAFFEKTGALPQNVGFAVKADHVIALAKDLPKPRTYKRRKQALRATEAAVCKVATFVRQ